MVAVGEIELISTTVWPGFQSVGHAVLGKEHRFHVGRIGHHHNDDIRCAGDFTIGRLNPSTAVEQIPRQRRIKVDQDQFVAGCLQVAGHGTTHDAQADKAYNRFIAQTLFLPEIALFCDGIPAGNAHAVFYLADSDIGKGQRQSALLQMTAKAVTFIGKINVTVHLAVENKSVERANVERLNALGIALLGGSSLLITT